MSTQASKVKNRDVERVALITSALREANLDAVICALPTNVLMLSGYWPVVGTSVVIATQTGSIHLLVPEDEADLARHGWADEVHTFAAASLTEIGSPEHAVRDLLKRIVATLGLRRGSLIGYENGNGFEPASYVAIHLYGTAIRDSLIRSVPSPSLRPADKLLVRLRSVMTHQECERVRVACRIAEGAFLTAVKEMRSGLRETEVAELFRAGLSTPGIAHPEIDRTDGFIFCMSGSNAASACAAYQRSRAREIGNGDLVLVHCNSYADGFWTDITRTFCLGEMNKRKHEMYSAVLEARAAALAAIRPGVRAAVVDRAARDVLKRRGFGDQFKHGLGHGVGFAAINHNAPPRLHPASNDVLEVGMIFNIEPAIYFEDLGLRHCDMAVVTQTGVQLLTRFQSTIEELHVLNRQLTRRAHF